MDVKHYTSKQEFVTLFSLSKSSSGQLYSNVITSAYCYLFWKTVFEYLTSFRMMLEWNLKFLLHLVEYKHLDNLSNLVFVSLV